MDLIVAKNLQKTYRHDGVETRAVRGASFTIREGEFVSIVGPSGSGKSTLMQMLGFLDRPTGGEYFFEGKEVSEYKDDDLAFIRNKKVGFVFQTFNLLSRLTVSENVAIPLVYAGVPPAKREERVREVVEVVGLSDRLDYEASKLSGGQQQRVAIARALVNEPAIVFADEPTGNLDSESGEAILGFLQTLHEEGNTIVVITHESYVARSAERMLHMMDGHIVKDEPVEKRNLVNRDGFSK